MDNEEQTNEELSLLNVIREALDRRDEVFQIIDDASDEAAAIASLGQLLNAEEHHCHAILDLSVSKWLGSWRDRLEERAETLRLRLEREAPQP